jgi:hypothetical protein
MVSPVLDILYFIFIIAIEGKKFKYSRKLKARKS